MPFDFLKRKKDATQVAGTGEGTGGPAGRGVPFDGLTEEWRIVGEMHITGSAVGRAQQARGGHDLGGSLGAGRRLRGAFRPRPASKPSIPTT